MEGRRRNSLRLQGYDYAEAGDYFVTICTKGRVCTLGKVGAGEMSLSDQGMIVAACWKEIPNRFPDVTVGTVQIMPNHVHGIITIKRGPSSTVPHSIMSNSAGGVQSDATGNIGGDLNDEPAAGRKWILMNQSGIPLGKIIRSFKAHCTRTIRKVVQTPFLWQRGFYDHIIRSDIDYYFIERYIQLNPLLWYLDSDNADAHGLQREDLESFLREKRILDENTIMFLIEHEMNYLAWRTESV